jgi:hypothetical protein
LLTQFSGTITAVLDNFRNPTSITFQDANIVGSVNGTWQPNDTGGDFEPAGEGNYGIAAGEFGVGKIRNLAFSLGSTGAASIAGGQFQHASQEWSHSAGNLDIRAFAIPAGGTSSLTGIAQSDVLNTSATDGSFSVAGDLATLVLPVDIVFAYEVPGNPLVTGQLRYTGALTATAVPEPSSLMLLSIAALFGLAFHWRRRVTRHSY